MPKLTPEKLQELYQKLPQDVRDVYASADTTQTLEKIGGKHGIHIDDLGELVSETGLVMVGFTHPRDYIRNLAKRMEIDPNKARAIAGDVNEQIFKQLRESLKKIHNIREAGAKAPSSKKPISVEIPSIPKEKIREKVTPQPLKTPPVSTITKPPFTPPPQPPKEVPITPPKITSQPVPRSGGKKTPEAPQIRPRATTLERNAPTRAEASAHSVPSTGVPLTSGEPSFTEALSKKITATEAPPLHQKLTGEREAPVIKPAEPTSPLEIAPVESGRGLEEKKGATPMVENSQEGSLVKKREEDRTIDPYREPID